MKTRSLVRSLLVGALVLLPIALFVGCGADAEQAEPEEQAEQSEPEEKILRIGL